VTRRLVRRNVRLSRRTTLILQVLIVVAALLGWEYVPKIEGASKISPLFDVFFISSPTRVYQTLVNLANGKALSGPIWPFIQVTVTTAVVGTLIGMVFGTALGLLLSNDRRLNQILRPFVVSLNAVPRIAIIPIIVILLGASTGTSVMTAAITGFFSVFFNAYEGGRSLPPQALDNARVLGASPYQMMRFVRLPYVVAWSFATLPNAISHGLLSVVTAEILTGYAGMGRLLIFAIGAASASLTIAVVVTLSVVGLVLVALGDVIRRRWLHWWIDGRAA